MRTGWARTRHALRTCSNPRLPLEFAAGVSRAARLPQTPRTFRGSAGGLDASLEELAASVRSPATSARGARGPIAGREAEEQKGKTPQAFIACGVMRNNPGGVLLSHRASPAVPLAPKSLTSEFEMGSGVASSRSPPENFGHKPRAPLQSLAVAVRSQLQRRVRVRHVP